MSIASEITRLQTAKADIKTSIENKGVTVPSNASIDTYYDYIDQIPSGGGAGGPDFTTQAKVENQYVSDWSPSSTISYQVTMSNGPEIKIKWARIYNLSDGTYTTLTDGTYTAYYHYQNYYYHNVGSFVISDGGTKIKITKYNEYYNVNYWSCVSNSGVSNPSKLRIIIAVDTPQIDRLSGELYTNYPSTGNSRTSSDIRTPQ